jgi:hypothetical protein
MLKTQVEMFIQGSSILEVLSLTNALRAGIYKKKREGWEKGPKSNANACPTSRCKKTCAHVKCTIPSLFQARISIHLLTITSPPLNRIHTHLNTRPHSSMHGKHLFLSAIFSPCPSKASQHTFVPAQPKRYASSLANSSPNPSIRPLTKGRKRLMAAPRNRPRNVGGE